MKKIIIYCLAVAAALSLPSCEIHPLITGVTVTFTLKADALKFFDDRKQDWVAEPGKFKAYIGASSADLRGEVTFTYE